MAASKIKDPDALLDYTFLWNRSAAGGTGWLTDANGNVDTIIAASGLISNDDGTVFIANESFTTSSHTIWVSGGTLGKEYIFVSRIWTADGRRNDQSMYIQIQNK